METNLSIEFLQCVDNGQLLYRNGDKLVLFTKNSKCIIKVVNDIVKERFPTTWQRLCKLYDTHPHNSFLKARRFAKCNFSLLDSVPDIAIDGSVNLEFVQCPLRGECEDEGIICSPKAFSILSSRQLDVVRLIDQGLKDQVIGDRLFISPLTVKTHVKHMLEITKCSNRTELAHFCRTHNFI